MADTRRWGSHDHQAPYLMMPQLQHTYLHGHCTHQHPSCRCHGGYHNTTHGYHQHHHHNHSHQQNYYSHSHHGGHHYEHGDHHYHRHLDHTYRPRPTRVIHQHYTEQDTPGPKLLPLPPPEPKLGPKRPAVSGSLSEEDQMIPMQHTGSQAELPCPKCEGGWCSVHNTECATFFQCPACEAKRDIKRHQETQAQQDCPTCESRPRIMQYNAETQAHSECEVCERQRCLIRHDAESQVAMSCPECDQKRYCQTSQEVQVSMDCKACEGRRIAKRDMATQVDNIEVELTGVIQKKHEVTEDQKETEQEEQEKGCQICSMLMKRLEKSDFLDGEELLGSYVITTKMADTSKKPKVKVTRKVKESHRTSTPRQGPFDTFAEHLGGTKY